MSDEPDEASAFEEEDAGRRRRSGHGFRLGLLLGLITGVVGATLFAPPTGEEEGRTGGVLEPGSREIDEGTPVARMRAVLDQVRTRIREASREAELAARETEEMAHARYAELTHQNGSGE